MGDRLEKAIKDVLQDGSPKKIFFLVTENKGKLLDSWFLLKTSKTYLTKYDRVFR